MVIRFLRAFISLLLRLRYRIRVVGYEDILARGRKGILFLPNHPALIDPVIVATVLYQDFSPYALIDAKQLRGKFIRLLKKHIRFLPLPDLGYDGAHSIRAVEEQLKACSALLNAQENLIFYPSGRITRSKFEDLRSNRGVKTLFEQAPGARVVLIRTSGLWGSSFGMARGYGESFDQVIRSHVKHLLLNFFLFMPKRRLTVTFQELPQDFPKDAERQTINRKLEAFYNQTAQPNTFIPYYWWQGDEPKLLPEPVIEASATQLHDLPLEAREKVFRKLSEMTERDTIRDSDLLRVDLEMDSVNVAELAAWIQGEFSCQVDSPETLQTVANVLMATQGSSSGLQPLKPIPEAWHAPQSTEPLFLPDVPKVTDAFLWHARRTPGRVLMADQLKGIMTYRKAVMAIMVLSRELRELPGDAIGILMPSTMATNLLFLASLFSGKTPVMLNWTVGRRNLSHAVESTGLSHIVTSRTVVQKLAGQGADFSDIREHFIYLEELAETVSVFSKISSLIASHVSWRSLRKAQVPDTAVLLFTSGSESYPKTVPLSHQNLMSCGRSAMAAMGFQYDDVLMGMLPPFHSLGVLLNLIGPDCAGMRAVYHPNPMEGDMLTRLIAAYKATIIVGTPTFAAGIYRGATSQQLASIRTVLVGAESCPQTIFDLIIATTPQAHLLEGYGITECSPVVGVNTPESHKLGSLGHPISCMEWTIRDEALRPTPRGETGMLYVRGPNVFSGYLNFDGPSPFVDFDGASWFRTGDLVSIAEDGFMMYQGRLSRFVKVGGEMISLPAIESILSEHLEQDDDKLRTFAVENTGEAASPLITLFTTVPREREEVNRLLADAGLSPISFIRRIVVVPEIPLLGTGKTDYRSLAQLCLSKAKT